MKKKMKKKINVNDLNEILKKEFNSDLCTIDGIEVVTEGRTPHNPEYIEIGKGRVLNIYMDLGDFLCAECDSNADKEEYQELHCAIDHDHVDMSLSTAFFRHRRIQEIEEEYGADITNKWLEELAEEGKQMPEEEKEFEKGIIEDVEAIATRIANCIDSKYPSEPTPKWSYDLYDIANKLAEHYDFKRIYPKDDSSHWIRKDKEG